RAADALSSAIAITVASTAASTTGERTGARATLFAGARAAPSPRWDRSRVLDTAFCSAAALRGMRLPSGCSVVQRGRARRARTFAWSLSPEFVRPVGVKAEFCAVSVGREGSWTLDRVRGTIRPTRTSSDRPAPGPQRAGRARPPAGPLGRQASSMAAMARDYLKAISERVVVYDGGMGA